MLFLRIVQDLTANNSHVTSSNLHVEILLWVYILQGLIEISSQITVLKVYYEVQFRMSLLFLFVCVELVTEEKYESVTKWNGLPCALQDVFDVLSMYFWYSVLVFLITGLLCSQRYYKVNVSSCMQLSLSSIQSVLFLYSTV